MYLHAEPDPASVATVSRMPQRWEYRIVAVAMSPAEESPAEESPAEESPAERSSVERERLTVPGPGQAANRRLLAIALLALVLGTGFLQMNRALGGVEVPGQPSTTLSAVGSPLNMAQSRLEARCAWRAWSAEGAVTATAPKAPTARAAPASCAAPIESTGDRAATATVARGLVRLAVAVDGVFVLCYLTLAYQLRRRLRYRSRVLSRSPLRSGLLRLTGRVPMLLLGGALVGAEAAEGLAQWALAASGNWLSVDGAGAVLAVATPVKLVGFAMLVIPLLLLTLDTLGAAVRDHSAAGDTWWDRQRGRRQLVRLLRIPLVVLPLFAAALLLPLGDQAPDALLQWADGRQGFGGFAAGSAAITLLALMVWSSAHLAVTAEQRLITAGRGAPMPPRGLLALLLLVAGAAFWPPLRNLGALGLVLAAVVGLQWCVGVPPWLRREPQRLCAAMSPRGAAPGQAALAASTGEPVLRLGRILAAAVPFLLSFAVVRASSLPLAVGLASREPLEPGIVVLFLGGVAGLVASVRLAGWLATLDGEIATRQLPLRAAHVHRGLGLLALAWGGAAALWPHPVAVATGVVGITALGLAGALLLAGEAARWSERSVPVAGLRVLGFGRTPVFLLAAAWLLATPLLDTGNHHDVRVLRAAPGSATGSTVAPTTDTVAARWAAWLAANCAAATSPAGPAVPLVIVAAGGGGLRAAYWTAGVLDRLTAARGGGPVDQSCPAATPTSRIFALSGVSGGGLGVMSFAAEAAQSRPAAEAGWYRRPLGSDHLSPILARGLFADVPRTFLGLRYPDRAVALEQSLESLQPELGRPFFAGDAASRGRVPLVVVNGTSVESGCRIATAPTRLGDDVGGPSAPARRGDDVGRAPAQSAVPAPSTFGCRSLDTAGRLPALNQTVDYLCPGEDLRRSSAVLLGARFPWVSPAGRLRSCVNGETATYVADGGYAERTGARVATELTVALQRLVAAHNAAVTSTRGRMVQPWVLSIDNGYVTRAAPQQQSTPLSALVPFRTALAVREASNWADQQSLALAAPGRFVRVTPTRVPGVQAPLGWVLSDAAQHSLERQLDSLTTSRSWSTLRGAVTGSAPAALTG